MSDTPETDAARHDLTEYGPPTPCSYGDWVAADFACKLERERDEAQYKLEDARQSIEVALEDLSEAKRERDELLERNAKLRDIADRAIKLGQTQ